MNKVAAIFTSVYNTITKACKGVKNNYDTSDDDGKILWTYMAQLIACLFGIGIFVLLFIAWTDHREQVCIVDVENHNPSLSNDSCYLSVHATTGEAFNGENINGVKGSEEIISYRLDSKRNIDKRYSRDDVERVAKLRKIDLAIDSIKHDSCASIISFKGYMGSNIYGNGFYKRKINSAHATYIEDLYDNTELFAPATLDFIPKDSLPYIGLYKSYNKKIPYYCTRCIYLLGEQKKRDYKPSFVTGVNGGALGTWHKRGDLSTLNYFLLFNLKEIDLNEINISFKTPTVVNNIYPEPDVLDLYNMKYTNPVKLAHIQKNGLSCEMEFVSGKSLQEFRMNVLIMVMSILITYALTVIFRAFVLLCKPTYGLIKILFVYPVVSLIIALIVSKIVNLIYVPWTRFTFNVISGYMTSGYLIIYLYYLIISIFSHKLILKEKSIYFLWISVILGVYLLLIFWIFSLLQI